MNRWGKILLIVAAPFTFTTLAAWMTPKLPICRFILWPGAAIADSWLHMDLFQHPRAFGFASMALNVFIYSGLLGVCIILIRRLGCQVKP